MITRVKLIITKFTDVFPGDLTFLLFIMQLAVLNKLQYFYIENMNLRQYLNALSSIECSGESICADSPEPTLLACTKYGCR